MRVRPCALLGAALAFNLTALNVMVAPPAGAAGDRPSQASEPRSQLGSYLAGRLAGKVLDLPAASVFYEKALESHDWQTAEGFADRRATRENPYGHGHDVKVMTI